MALGKHDKNPLRPQMAVIAPRPFRRPRDEGDVELNTPDRGDVLGRIAVDKTQLDRWVTGTESGDQIRQKPGRQRRKNADPDMTVFAATDGADLVARKPDLRKRLATTMHELLAGMGQHHPARRADEQSRPETFLQFTDAPTDRRFLDAQRHRRPPKAAMLGRRNHITDVANLDRHFLYS